MRSARAIAIATLLIASRPVPAQSIDASARPHIPGGTAVLLELEQPVGSKLSKTGETFAFRLREPLRIEGVEVLPKGTPGGGEVIHAARARAAGKAGELILAARYLEHAGQRIKLRSFKLGQQAGESHAGAALALGVMAAPLALFIVGGEIEVPSGAVAHAKIAADVELGPAAAPTPGE